MSVTDPTGYISIPPELTRGVAWKKPVRVATTANITLSGTQTIDGVAVVAEDRVLCKDQTTGSARGIYVCKSGAWVRAFDMDQDLTTVVPAEEIAGAFVYVLAGTANAGKVYHTTNVAGGTLGSTTITWAEFVQGGTIPGFATPAIVLGTAAAAGAASTVIRSDSTIVAFDATVPTTIAYSDAAATGSAAVAARRDHRHGAPAAPSPAGVGPIIIADTHSTPLVFGDLIQNDAQDDLVYADI